jgi:hypothetical protein
MTRAPQFDPARSEAIRALLVETAAASRTEPRRRRRRWLVAGSIVIGSAALAGSAAAWGASHAGWIAAPSATPGGTASFAPIPHWPVNAKGQSYGSEGDSPIAPDLILATATNGRTGYVLRKDLEDADGTTAMKSFHSPQDALDWQKEHGGKTSYIPVYKADGTTKIGVFQVGSGAPDPN